MSGALGSRTRKRGFENCGRARAVSGRGARGGGATRRVTLPGLTNAFARSEKKLSVWELDE
jgi:hypothetical protein